MASFSMCVSHDCPVSGRCLRYRAIPSYVQSWGLYKPTSKDGCESFIPIRPGDRLNEKEGAE